MLLHAGFGCKEGGLGVEGVEDGFNQQQIYSALHQGVDLFAVGSNQLVKGDGPVGGVVDIGAHGAGLVGRANGASHVAGLGWLALCVVVGGTAGQLGCSQVYLADVRLGVVVGLADAGGVEAVGLNDVGSSLQVLAVDLLHQVRPRQAEQVVVAFQLTGEGSEQVATEVLFRQLLLLKHGAKCAIQNQYAFNYRLLYLLHTSINQQNIVSFIS